MDETKVIVSTGMHAGRTAPALQLARQTGHARHFKHPDAVGAHAIIALSGGAQYRVPAVCIGLTVGHPGGGVTNPVLDGIDLVERIDPTLVPQTRRKGQSGSRGAWQRYVVGDKAYPQAAGLNAGLLTRDFALLGLPSSGQRTYEVLAEAGSEATAGPMLTCHGTVVCPGINKRRLEASRDFKYPAVGSEPEAFRVHAATERYLAAFTMGKKWRTPRLRRAEGGRPPAATVPGSEAPQQWKLQVACPAQEARVICPLVVRSPQDTADLRAKGVPEVEGRDVPTGVLPRCCPGKTSVVVFEEDRLKRGVKYWQPLMAESEKHWSIYNPSRSRTESYFSQLKSPTGGNFRAGRTEWRRDSLWTIAMAMAAMNTNLRFIAAFAQNASLPEAPPAPTAGQMTPNGPGVAA